MMNIAEQARAHADACIAVLPNNILVAPASFACDTFRPIVYVALPAPDQAPGWMLTDEEIATMPYCGDGIAPELRA